MLRNTDIVIIIPAFKESGLTTSLDSLFYCDPCGASVEVHVLINFPEYADDEVKALNEQIYLDAKHWASKHEREDMRFVIDIARDLPKKHAGAGLARKILMDEVVGIGKSGVNSEQAEASSSRYKAESEKLQDTIIVSLDADTSVAPNYIQEIYRYFSENPDADGCSIAFAHPLEGDEFPDENYQAILNYELHLRYYYHGLKSTGYPWVYYTVGSAFAVRAETYVKEGGMSKRQAGEDFYFIQKVARLGKFGELKTTVVCPSPRRSDRVPFGTGPDIASQLSKEAVGLKSYESYDPRVFEMLRAFYGGLGTRTPAAAGGLGARTPSAAGGLGTGTPAAAGELGTGTPSAAGELGTGTPAAAGELGTGTPAAAGGLGSWEAGELDELSKKVLSDYLEKTGFEDSLKEIRENTATEEAFRLRFFRKFDLFWALKFIHYAEDVAFPKIDLLEGVEMLLKKQESREKYSRKLETKRNYLEYFRNIDII